MKKIFAIIGDTTTTENGTRKANKRRVPIYTTAHETELTDTAAAYLMEEAKRATFRALKTVYQKSASPYIFGLVKEAAAALGQNKMDFENWIQAEKGNAIVEAKTHTRQRDKLTGKMIECRPVTTFKWTETGRAINEAETQGAFDTYNLDVYDLINTAYLAFLELVECGAIIDFRDIKRNRGHVYASINREIYSNKKAMNENDLFRSFCVVSSGSDKDNTYTETLYTGKHIDHIRVDYEATLQVVLECVRRVAAKQADTAAAVRAFELCTVYGMTRTEAAAAMGKNEKQVRRYIELVERIADNAETRQMLSELLM